MECGYSTNYREIGKYIINHKRLKYGNKENKNIKFSNYGYYYEHVPVHTTDRRKRKCN